jgi:hypothetical protein
MGDADRAGPATDWRRADALFPEHGTEDELRAEACQHPRSDSWRQARSFVAGELVDLIDAGILTLADFQRTVMVPLELDVISCPGAAHWQPGQMVSGLLRALPDTRGRPRQ